MKVENHDSAGPSAEARLSAQAPAERAPEPAALQSTPAQAGAVSADAVAIAAANTTANATANKVIVAAAAPAVQRSIPEVSSGQETAVTAATALKRAAATSQSAAPEAAGALASAAAAAVPESVTAAGGTALSAVASVASKESNFTAASGQNASGQNTSESVSEPAVPGAVSLETAAGQVTSPGADRGGAAPAAPAASPSGTGGLSADGGVPEPLQESAAHADNEDSPSAGTEARYYVQALRYAQKYGKPTRPGMVISPKVRRSIRLISICALLFAAYYAYNVFWGPSEEKLSFQDLQLRLPLKIDAHTVLESAEEVSTGLELKIVKAPEAFIGLDETAVLAGLDRLASNAVRLCNNHMFQKVIADGKSVKVQLEVSGGPVRTVVLDSCPLPGGKKKEGKGEGDGDGEGEKAAGEQQLHPEQPEARP